MTTVESGILQALVELEQAARAMASANPKPNLTPIFARLDRLAAQLPPNADPGLRHYLQKKSYQKARLWLEGRDLENQAGQCGPHQD